MSVTPDRMALFKSTSLASSQAATRVYSTSFSLAIRALAPEIRDAVYAVYGFVRLADEIVDSFHSFDQPALFARLKRDTSLALRERISTNPILHAFQWAFHAYGIDSRHVDQFMQSMEWDLDRTAYSQAEYETYVVGSAEVVGLMCLRIFVRGDDAEYSRLEPTAVKLGAAFQKVNFLRDLNEDYRTLGRTYFPQVEMDAFDDAAKRAIERDIERDLTEARQGIKELPRDARFGVYLAYTYYRQLLKRLKRVPSSEVMATRVRVPDAQKAMLMASAYLRHKLNAL